LDQTDGVDSQNLVSKGVVRGKERCGFVPFAKVSLFLIPAISCQHERRVAR